MSAKEHRFLSERHLTWAWSEISAVLYRQQDSAISFHDSNGMCFVIAFLTVKRARSILDFVEEMDVPVNPEHLMTRRF